MAPLHSQVEHARFPTETRALWLTVGPSRPVSLLVQRSRMGTDVWASLTPSYLAASGPGSCSDSAVTALRLEPPEPDGASLCRELCDGRLLDNYSVHPQTRLVHGRCNGPEVGCGIALAPVLPERLGFDVRACSIAPCTSWLAGRVQGVLRCLPTAVTGNRRDRLGSAALVSPHPGASGPRSSGSRLAGNAGMIHSVTQKLREYGGALERSNSTRDLAPPCHGGPGSWRLVPHLGGGTGE